MQLGNGQIAELDPDEIYIADESARFLDGGALREHPLYKLVDRDIVLADAGQIFFILGVADEIKPRHTEPALVDCFVIQRITVRNVRRSYHGEVVVYDADIPEIERKPPRRDRYLLAVRTVVVQRPAEIVIAGLKRCSRAHT